MKRVDKQIMPWVYDDGGRAEAGFKKKNTGDCVCRAIAIATQVSYVDVHEALNHISQSERPRRGRKKSAAETGIKIPTIRRFMQELEWVWTPTMFIGSGCKVHLRVGELPTGRLVVNCSRHVVAVLDGVIHDTHDPSRRGTRCVYGFWRPA